MNELVNSPVMFNVFSFISAGPLVWLKVLDTFDIFLSPCNSVEKRRIRWDFDRAKMHHETAKVRSISAAFKTLNSSICSLYDETTHRFCFRSL